MNSTTKEKGQFPSIPQDKDRTEKMATFKTSEKNRTVTVVLKSKKNGNTRVDSPAVDRIQLLELVEQAGLLEAMLEYAPKRVKTFTSMGVKEARNLLSLNTLAVRKMITNMHPKGFVIIEDWLLEFCNAELEKYSGNDKTLRFELQDQLAGHMLYVRSGNGMNWAVEKPLNQPTRARLLIAALYHKDFSLLAEEVLKLGSTSFNEKDGDNGSLLSMRDIVFSPEQNLKMYENERNNLNIFIVTAIAIRVRNFEYADKMMNLLKRRNDTFFPKGGYDLLKEEYEKIRPLKTLPNKMRTMRALKGEFDKVDALEVLAQVKKITDGEGKSQTGFSSVIAVRCENTEEWKECSTEEFEQLFPDRGSIVHLVGTGNPALPKLNSHAIWRVMEQQFITERQKEHKTNIKAIQKISPVWQVLYLENIKSTDTDKVRSWITSHFESLANLSEGEILLYFSDGLFGHTNSSYVKLIEGGFTQNLRAWKNLPVIETSTGKVLHIGELPDTEREIDLSPPYELLTRAVRERAAYTNAERQKFTQILRELGSHQALSACMNEIKLDNLERSDEKFEKLEQNVLKFESVQEMLADARNRVVSKAKEDTAKEREELDRLIVREKDLLAKIERKEENLKNSKGEMKQLIREMIQEARRAGRNQAIRTMFDRGLEEGIEAATDTPLNKVD